MRQLRTIKIGLTALLASGLIPTSLLRVVKIVWRIFIAFVLLLVLGLTLRLFVGLEESTRADLVLNLVSEGLGIVVTVLVIDQLIKYREDARRRPAQKATYAHLHRLTSNIIRHIIPSELRIIFSDFDMLSFGRFDVVANVNTSLLQRKLPALRYEIHRELDNHKRFDIAPLLKAGQQLNAVIDRSSFLLELELLHLLMQLDDELTIHSDSSSLWDFSKSEGPDMLLLCSAGLDRLLRQTMEVRLWLEKRVDIRQRVTIPDNVSDVLQESVDKSQWFSKATIPDAFRKNFEDLGKSPGSSASTSPQHNKKDLPQ